MTDRFLNSKKMGEIKTTRKGFIKGAALVAGALAFLPGFRGNARLLDRVGNGGSTRQPVAVRKNPKAVSRPEGMA